jgi:hypothetical protein
MAGIWNRLDQPTEWKGEQEIGGEQAICRFRRDGPILEFLSSTGERGNE